MEFHAQLLALYENHLAGLHAFPASGLAAMAVLASDPGRAMTIGEVASRLEIDRRAASSIMKRLNEAGLHGDGLLTDAGRRAMGVVAERKAAAPVSQQPAVVDLDERSMKARISTVLSKLRPDIAQAALSECEFERRLDWRLLEVGQAALVDVPKGKMETFRVAVHRRRQQTGHDLRLMKATPTATFVYRCDEDGDCEGMIEARAKIFGVSPDEIEDAMRTPRDRERSPALSADEQEFLERQIRFRRHQYEEVVHLPVDEARRLFAQHKAIFDENLFRQAVEKARSRKAPAPDAPDDDEVMF